MSDSTAKTVEPVEKAETFVEGLDFYFDKDLMVLTRRYLLGRGTCCDSGCRHCPYRDKVAESSE